MNPKKGEFKNVLNQSINQEKKESKSEGMADIAGETEQLGQEGLQQESLQQEEMVVEENIQEEILEESPGSFLDNLTNLFVAPKKLMVSLDKRPQVLIPLLIHIIIVAGGVLLMKDLIIEKTIQYAQNNPGMLGQMDVTQYAQLIQGTFFWTVIMAGFTPVLALIIKGLMTLWIGRLMGGEASFKKIFSVLTFSKLIESIGSLPFYILGMIFANPYFSPALSMLLKDGFGNPFFSLLAGINLLTLWYEYVAGLGLAQVHGISKTKGMLLSFGTFALYLLLLLAQSIISMNVMSQLQ